jgi:hypothetical protein
MLFWIRYECREAGHTLPSRSRDVARLLDLFVQCADCETNSVSAQPSIEVLAAHLPEIAGDTTLVRYRAGIHIRAEEGAAKIALAAFVVLPSVLSQTNV